MTESSETNTGGWSSKQTWFKDVLSKSGTELLKITTNKNKNNKTKNNAHNVKISTNSKQHIDKESSSKMVYYQSNPLIVKTEQPSQVQFCAPASGATTTTTTPPPASVININQYYQNAHEQHKSLNYNGFNGVRAEIHPPQTSSQTEQQSINNAQMHNLNNIKLELLPPGITLYAKSATPTTAGSDCSPEQTSSSTLTTLTNVKTTSSSNGRRTNNNGNKPQFKCEQCGMTFGSKSAHTSHTKSHAKSNAKAAGNKDAGTQDIGNDANLPLGIPKMPQIKAFANGFATGDPYQCNVCQKTFAVPARLIRHYRTHTGERPFECEFCHKLFSVKENLQVHRRIHTKERPYKCDVCGRAFEHSGKLHRHMRIHTGERPHKCNVCEKTFIQSGQLVIHMRTHTGEKPYKCPVEGCGKGFTCSKQLKVHSRTHTGEKPYHCDICFRDFGYNHVLKLHRVQHYGSKCYKCTICDETFKSKKEMEAHIKGHANELPDEEEATNSALVNTNSSSASICSASSTNSVSSSGDINSAPSSPQSTKTKKTRKLKVAKTEIRTPSPSSPSSTMSPFSSLASASRHSAGSPLEALSPQQNETEQYSRDVKQQQSNRMCPPKLNFSAYAQPQQQQQHHEAQVQLQHMTDAYADEFPTDLSIPHQQQSSTNIATLCTDTIYYQKPITQPNAHYSIYERPATITCLSPTQSLYQQQLIEEQEQRTISPQVPTINPALLEAASIASRRAMLFDTREEEVTQAALQIMQLHRSQQPIYVQATPSTVTVSALSPSQKSILAASETAQYDDTTEANELIERYKRGDLAGHGIHKRTAPVPKFESALLNNEIIVRQVEAAIAPLRSSTESPERSSSPESDSMLMADRDVMTLPLRKRKLRPLTPTNLPNAIASTKENHANGNGLTNEPKVMRLNSVIQFAKSS